MAIIRPMAKRKRSEHYVNNKEFLAALIKYQEDIEIARLQDKPKPVIPRYIGECFLKIANHLSFKPNFVNYMFKEDMISGYQEVFDDNNQIDGSNYSDYNSIKDAVHSKLRN